MKQMRPDRNVKRGHKLVSVRQPPTAQPAVESSRQCRTPVHRTLRLLLLLQPNRHWIHQAHATSPTDCESISSLNFPWMSPWQTRPDWSCQMESHPLRAISE